MEPKKTPRTFDKIETIPANPNSIENGLDDPQPEKGPDGSRWRALISWIKGWGA